MFYLLLASDFVLLGSFALKFNRLPPQIPFFYSQTWGEDQLTDTWMLILLPLLCNILFFLNNYLYKKMFYGNLFVRKVIDIGNLFIVLSLSFIFIKIIFLVS